MSTNVEISKRLVFINGASSLLAKVLNVSILVWLQQYLLRRISTEEYSLYPVLMAVMLLVPLLTTILISGLSRYLVEAYARDDQQRVRQIVSTMCPLLFVAALVVLGGGGVFAWNVHRVLTVAPDRVDDARFMMALLMLMASIRVALVPFSLGLYVRQKFVVLNLIQVGAELLKMGILFALLFGISTRVRWVVVATVSANIVGLLVTVAWSMRLLPALRFRMREFRWPLVKELTSFGAWSFVGEAMHAIRTAADPLILNKLATATDVACFHLGNLAYTQINQGVGLTSAPLLPPMTAMHAAGDRERLGRTYLRGNRYAMWAALLPGLPALIFSHELIALYVGDELQSAATVLLLLMAQFPIVYTSFMLSKIAVASANLRAYTLFGLVTHIANLALTLYVVGALKQGAIGAAAARLAVALACQPLFVPLGMRLAGVATRVWLHQTVWLGLLPGLIGALIWLGLKLLLRPDSWLELGLCAAVGGLGYLVALYALALNKQERSDLLAVAQRVRGAIGRS